MALISNERNYNNAGFVINWQGEYDHASYSADLRRYISICLQTFFELFLLHYSIPKGTFLFISLSNISNTSRFMSDKVQSNIWFSFSHSYHSISNGKIPSFVPLQLKSIQHGIWDFSFENLTWKIPYKENWKGELIRKLWDFLFLSNIY